jgi:dihydroxyacid dehydratase/phosphogluconate dehydratase
MKRLQSRITVEGLDRRPHRAFLRGRGLDDAAIARPFIGVVTTDAEVTPGTMAATELDALERACLPTIGGDRIRIDGAAGTINLLISDHELARRRAAWRPPARARLSGLLQKYAASVGPAHLGAVAHDGAVDWPEEETP